MKLVLALAFVFSGSLAIADQSTEDHHPIETKIVGMWKHMSTVCINNKGSREIESHDVWFLSVGGNGISGDYGINSKNPEYFLFFPGTYEKTGVNIYEFTFSIHGQGPKTAPKLVKFNVNDELVLVDVGGHCERTERREETFERIL